MKTMFKTNKNALISVDMHRINTEHIKHILCTIGYFPISKFYYSVTELYSLDDYIFDFLIIARLVKP